MKIVIPVDEKLWNTRVCQSLGRAPYFLIFDSEKGEHSFVDNDAVGSSGGAGVKAAQTIVDSGINAVLTPRCGQNAAEVLRAGGVLIYRTAYASATDSLEAFTEGKLDLLEEIHRGFHRHGGR